ncbi:saccharopine dehydrogenase-like oxidoreductase [Lingula anatina]|uniref:Saccharopine dehydrogenase-like oxidoreductase n=1 Tax=Lingula anatina TaxID=7574 RepID=A0A1S3HWI7_LINAN|nr:saccharopine dehydrogenase-like oxidoreductase [Lingula anatina]|eukprot:XP_013390407.1 saccharopine dehydrogenase-like oxidoreductase [Lingula anatina]
MEGVRGAREYSAREYDFIVFGASGFTGQFVVSQLAKLRDEEPALKWAVGGRSMSKLVNTLKEAGSRAGTSLASIDCLLADSKDPDSLIELCGKGRVVLSCVGPYRFCGEPVVKACVEAGTNYVDICGEPQFLEEMQLRYDAQAKEKGIYIVGSCGFDSIPAEMGLLFTKNKFEGDLNSVESFIQIKFAVPEVKGAKINFATWQSAVHGFAHEGELKPLRKLLCPEPLPKPIHRVKNRGVLFYSKEVGSWCIPFLGSDRSIVYRSQVISYRDRKERPIQFLPYTKLPSLMSALAVLSFGIVFGILAKFKCGRWLLEKFPGIFSGGLVSKQGPPLAQIQGSSFTMTFFGKGYSQILPDADQQHNEAPDKTIVTSVTGPEAGYVTTPICMVDAALVILREQNMLPAGGGVIPPGAAFAKTSLIEKLQKHGMKFEVQPST